jgi:hypothetical protein
VVLVRERNIPTERQPFFVEVSANFFVDRGCRVVSTADPYGRNLGFLSSNSSVVLTRLSGPRSIPTTSQKFWERRESRPLARNSDH